MGQEYGIGQPSARYEKVQVMKKYVCPKTTSTTWIACVKHAPVVLNSTETKPAQNPGPIPPHDEAKMAGDTEP